MNASERMRACIGAIATLAALLTAPAYAADTIRISSEYWADATNRDGSGLYWDIVRAVYEPAGIDVERRIVPYARSIREVMATGKADAWVASYMDEVDGALYPEWHFDADYVAAVYDPERVSEVNGESSLRGRRVAWMRGYAYDDYLSVPVDETLVDDREGGLRMVEEGRIAFFIDAQVEVDAALEATGLGDVLDSATVLQLPLYLGFDDTDRGRELRAIWDRRFPQLLKDGTISRLYRKWDWGVWPFDDRYR